MTWDDGAQAYRYTITVTWQPLPGAPVIHLEEVGARLPVGYSYQAESAAGFADNLSLDEPNESLDAFGAYMLGWEFGSPLPSVSQGNPVETQSFYIIGEGSTSGHYTWAVASRDDVGSVGEITGTLYVITATSTDITSGDTTAIILADVMSTTDTTYITSWQVSK